MRKILVGILSILTIIAVVFIYVNATNVNYTDVGVAQALTYTHDGVEREYSLYIPENNSRNMTLVVALHEFGNFHYNFMRDAGLNDVAEEMGFVICYPQAVKGSYGQIEGLTAQRKFWNANFDTHTSDDLGFITELKEYLVSEYRLNDESYVIGYLSGGYMAYSLALHEPDHFKAIAAVGGRMSGNDWSVREMAQPVSILEVFDSQGEVYNGLVPTNSSETDFDWNGSENTDEIIEFWIGVNGCKDFNEEQVYENVKTVEYSNGIDNNKVVYCDIPGLEEAWPDSEYFNGKHMGRVAWDFFASTE